MYYYATIFNTQPSIQPPPLSALPPPTPTVHRPPPGPYSGILKWQY